MLEDNFGDIIRKSRMGLGLSLHEVAATTQIPLARLEVLEQCESQPNHQECNTLGACLGLHQEALWLIACEMYLPTPPRCANITVKTWQITAMRANCYLVKIGKGPEALIVDPGAEVPALLSIVKEESLQVCGILVTHGHSDHAGAVVEVTKKLQVPVLAHPAECAMPNSQALQGSGVYHLNGISIQALHCPGHSDQSYSFLVGGALFTGDTLFAGSMGRAASKQSYPKLLASGDQLMRFPVDTPVFPGHGPATTIGQERQHNPFLALRQSLTL